MQDESSSLARPSTPQDHTVSQAHWGQTANYLDMRPGPAQQAQCSISGTVNSQGHLLPQLLQAPLQLGSPGGEGVWRAVPAHLPSQRDGKEGKV